MSARRNQALTVCDRQEGSRGAGQEGRRQGPFEHWQPGHQEERQEMSGLHGRGQATGMCIRRHETRLLQEHAAARRRFSAISIFFSPGQRLRLAAMILYPFTFDECSHGFLASRRSSSALLSRSKVAGGQHNTVIQYGVVLHVSWMQRVIARLHISPYEEVNKQHMWFGDERYTQQSSPDSRPNDLEQLMKMDLIARCLRRDQKL
jgi:hypothetical protein